MKELLELNDVVLFPNKIGNSKRKDVDYFVQSEGYSSLPIFTSPMDSVVTSKNWETWKNVGIRPCFPRTEGIQLRLEACHYGFTAFGIEEVIQHFLGSPISQKCFVCIDAGNGHDPRILNVGTELKKRGHLVMGGNISSPEAYYQYSMAGFDYVRIGMFGGSLCQRDKFGFHYPTASLIEDIVVAKNAIPGFNGPSKNQAKIIVDGGISTPSDIVKALAIGADYVMAGKQFAGLYEAAGKLYKEVVNKDTSEISIEPVKSGKVSRRGDLIRLYSGNTDPKTQAVRQGYSDVDSWLSSGGQLKISDAKSQWIPVKKSVSEWVQELKDCIDYAFAITGSKDWKEFKVNVSYGHKKSVI